MEHSRRCKNIIQDLRCRQMGVRNPRSTGYRIIKRKMIGTAPLSLVMSKEFAPSHLDIHDQTIRGKISSTQREPGLHVYKLCKNVTTGDQKVLRKVFSVPQPRNGRNVDSIIHECYYPYSRHLPKEDFVPAMFVLQKDRLLRFNYETFQLISSHDLSFTGVFMTRLELDHDNDWLIIKSIVSRPRVTGHKAVETMFVVFSLHPFLYRCTLKISGQHFPSYAETTLYGNMHAADVHGSFLTLNTDRKYVLIYDLEELVAYAPRGELTPVKPASEVLLAIPSEPEVMSVEEQSGHYTLLYGDGYNSMRVTSAKKIIEYMCTQNWRHMSPDPHAMKMVAKSIREYRVTNPQPLESKPLVPSVVAARMEMACSGEPVQWRGGTDGRYHGQYSVDFFPGNYNKILMQTQSQLRILDIPFRTEVSQHAPLVGDVVMLCSASSDNGDSQENSYGQRGLRSRSGRPINPPYRHGGQGYGSGRDNEALSLAVCYSCNLLLALSSRDVEEDTPGLSVLTCLRLYDVHTFKLLRVIPLEQLVQHKSMLLMCSVDMTIEGETLYISVRNSDRVNLFVYKFRLEKD